MKALVKLRSGEGNVELCDVPEPVCEPGKVKLAVDACGICGTDLHVYHDTFRNYPPVILGHEFVGHVVEVGQEVGESFEDGARYAVLGATAVTCGRCQYCRSGEFMFCPSRRGMGHGVDGAFARYVCVRPDQMFRIDSHLPDDEGALVEPLAVAVHAVAEITEVRPGDVALISGPGPIGVLCLLVLAHQGIKTLVAGKAADVPRLDLARRCGASRVIDVDRENLAEIIRAETDGRGLDVAFEASGAAASAVACLGALRPFGRYTQVGHFGDEICVPFDQIGFKQLQVRGSVGYTVATWERALRLMVAGLRPSRIVTHRLPLTRWQEGFDIFQRKLALKVLLYPELEGKEKSWTDACMTKSSW